MAGHDALPCAEDELILPAVRFSRNTVATAADRVLKDALARGKAFFNPIEA